MNPAARPSSSGYLPSKSKGPATTISAEGRLALDICASVGVREVHSEWRIGVGATHVKMDMELRCHPIRPPSIMNARTMPVPAAEKTKRTTI